MDSKADLTVRDERPDDRAEVRRVVVAAFGQPAEADLVDALRYSGDAALSLVAEHDAVIVGHVLWSRLKVPEGCLALAPVAVRPDRQRQGVGSALIEVGLRRARQDGWKAAFVLGEPAYYRRFGFDTATAERFDVGYPKDYFMAVQLVPDALAGCGGNVIYAQPFLDLD